MKAIRWIPCLPSSNFRLNGISQRRLCVRQKFNRQKYNSKQGQVVHIFRMILYNHLWSLFTSEVMIQWDLIHQGLDLMYHFQNTLRT